MLTITFAHYTPHQNGCAWLNHSSGDEERRVFLRLCKEHHCIKAWFSGHFHLSHDYPVRTRQCLTKKQTRFALGVGG